jgi:hypothetical protein
MEVKENEVVRRVAVSSIALLDLIATSDVENTCQDEANTNNGAENPDFAIGTSPMLLIRHRKKEEPCGNTNPVPSTHSTNARPRNE